MDNKSLQARLAALRETAVKLNAASDALTQRIRNTESQLEALKLGVAVIRSEAFRRDWETEIINSGPPPVEYVGHLTEFHLGYKRWHGSWRIVVVQETRRAVFHGECLDQTDDEVTEEQFVDWIEGGAVTEGPPEEASLMFPGVPLETRIITPLQDTSRDIRLSAASHLEALLHDLNDAAQRKARSLKSVLNSGEVAVPRRKR